MWLIFYAGLASGAVGASLGVALARLSERSR
jgi:hypothetical protein